MKKTYHATYKEDSFNKTLELLYNNNDQTSRAMIDDLILSAFKHGIVRGIGHGIVISGTAVTLVCCVSLIAKRMVTLIKKHDEKNKAKKRSLNKDSFFL